MRVPRTRPAAACTRTCSSVTGTPGSDGRRSQLFLAAFGTDGKLGASPVWLTHGIDGDVPSKPEGDDSEYSFSPDGSTVYFDARIAGTSEALVHQLRHLFSAGGWLGRS